jgi:imidazolonepropionase
MSDLGVIADGSLLIDGEIIVEVGPTRRLENLRIARDARVVDASGKVLLPGLIDSHSRPLFERTEEWSRFLGGDWNQAGQLKRHAAQLRSPRSLLAAARQWTYEMAACGTTTAEIRTGGRYEAVRRELRAVSLLSDDPIDAAGVFWAGPTPKGDDESEFVDIVGWAARSGAAYACELPCGPAGLRVAEARRRAAAARLAGLRVKLLTGSSAPRSIGELASQTAALSVDLAGAADAAEVALLGSSGSIVTLLPGLSQAMKTGYPPGRELIDQGGAVCLATAFGPDSCASLSLPMMMTLACSKMSFTAEEAIAACTINAAAAMARQQSIGSIEPGKRADLALFSVPDYRLIPYYFGFNLCAMTIRQGKIIYRGATAPRLAPVRSRQA